AGMTPLDHLVALAEKLGLKFHLLGADNRPIAVDFWTFAAMRDEQNWQVARDVVGDNVLSTVFLGKDHNFFGMGPTPLWFETMAFKNGDDFYCERYETWEQAVEGHNRALELLKAGVLKDD